MIYRQVIRSFNSLNRQFERNSRQRQRALEIRKKEIARMQESERAALEVELYENRIDVIKSIHKDCSKEWEWEKIRDSKAPVEPIREDTNEIKAVHRLKRFKPNIFHKIFKLTESKKNKLQNEIVNARKRDENLYQKALNQYHQDFTAWEESKGVADKILKGDIETYSDVLKETDPFSEIKELGGSIKFSLHNSKLIEVELMVHGEEAIPSEIKILLQSGKLSIKKMPKSKFYELYQDYICSCVIRVARELFALLPLDMIIIHAMDKILNTKTGYLEEQPILSVKIPRTTLESLNLSLIDPSDSMNNFLHNMKFKTTSGFNAVEKIAVDISINT